MKRHGWLAAMIVVLLANAVALSFVAINRGGAPDAVVVLTDQQLPLAGREDDDSGVTLRLNDGDLLTNHDWLDTEKMGQLGFDPAVLGDQFEARPPHWKLSAREAFVVLDCVGGPDEPSRLVAIDAGLDASVLRSRYSDRDTQIVVPALIGIKATLSEKSDAGEWNVVARAGRIQRILVARIHVPRQFHASLEPFFDMAPRPAEEAGPPRYRVTVSFGRRHEPWVRAVEAP